MGKRICIISEHASPLAEIGGVDSGGQNVYVGHVARRLARTGHTVDVFTRRDGTEPADLVEWEDGVRVVHVKAGPPEWVRKEDLLPYMDEFTGHCLDFMKASGGYDVIHANFFMSGLVAAEIKKRTGVPFIVTFHALGRVRRLYQKEGDAFPDERFAVEDRVVAGADRIIAECPQDREDLVSLYRAPPGRITVIPCGFDPAEFWPVERLLARRELGLPGGHFVVLQLGRIVPRKGIDTVIRGFARFLRDCPSPALLLIVGGESQGAEAPGRTELERLRRIAADLGVGGEVLFLGRRGRNVLRYYYSASDVFVTTPWYEPFGITPVEAMACGIPVIGSAVGGIKYGIVHDRTGYLVPAKDHEEVACRLVELYAHPELRERLGREGIRRANRRFTWEKVASMIGTVIEEVAREARPGHLRRRLGPPGSRRQLGLVRDSSAAIIKLLRLSGQVLCPSIIAAAEAIGECFEKGGKLLACGNGGAATEAQHFVGELVGQFKRRGRPGLPAVALTADSTILTAVSNDMGYENVFARQVQALGKPGDLLVCITTNGKSQSLLKACGQARELGLACIVLSGARGGDLTGMADIAIPVPAYDEQRVQEVHLLALHLICTLVEERIAASLPGRLKAGLSAWDGRRRFRSAPDQGRTRRRQAALLKEDWGPLKKGRPDLQGDA
ncbi:MAG: glycosyltransferase [Syntrophorhabdales bacterium]|jgi:phosphoheptose isomerase/glycosyltransferase involved in cell wall biosynthesis